MQSTKEEEEVQKYEFAKGGGGGGTEIEKGAAVSENPLLSVVKLPVVNSERRAVNSERPVLVVVEFTTAAVVNSTTTNTGIGVKFSNLGP